MDPACCIPIYQNPSSFRARHSPTMLPQEADLERPLILTAEALSDNLTRMTALLGREGLPELAEAFRSGGGGLLGREGLLPELAEAFGWWWGRGSNRGEEGDPVKIVCPRCIHPSCQTVAQIILLYI